MRDDHPVTRMRPGTVGCAPKRVSHGAPVKQIAIAAGATLVVGGAGVAFLTVDRTDWSLPQVLHAQDWSEYEHGHDFVGTWGGLPIEVVDPGLEGWPTHALRWGYNRTGATLIGEEGWPAPPVGDSIFYHYLFYEDLPIDARGSDHGLQSNIGRISHMWLVAVVEGQENPTPDQTFGLGFNSYSDGDGTFLFYNHGLPRKTPLRVEWGLVRVAELQRSCGFA